MPTHLTEADPFAGTKLGTAASREKKQRSNLVSGFAAVLNGLINLPKNIKKIFRILFK